MTDSPALKLDQAARHISNLAKLFSEKRPFSYVVETNEKTGQRATYAKRNKAVCDEAALICGDVVHNLRSALDHAFLEIVSPHATSDKERQVIQFPFCQEAARIDEAVKQRLADRVSDKFFDAVKGLRPYKDPGGNEFLYLIHEFDLLDKHKHLIPTGDYTKLSWDLLRRQIPDLPRISGALTFGGNRRDIVWTSGKVPIDQIGEVVPPTSHMFERRLAVPVEVVFDVKTAKNPRKIIPTLNAMVDAAKEAVKTIQDAS
jgi:hypothetical protein